MRHDAKSCVKHGATDVPVEDILLRQQRPALTHRMRHQGAPRGTPGDLRLRLEDDEMVGGADEDALEESGGQEAIFASLG